MDDRVIQYNADARALLYALEAAGPEWQFNVPGYIEVHLRMPDLDDYTLLVEVRTKERYGEMGKLGCYMLVAREIIGDGAKVVAGELVEMFNCKLAQHLEALTILNYAAEESNK